MRPNSSSSSSSRLSGRRRANRRLPSSQPSASSGKGLFSRIRARWLWLLGQRFHYAAAIFVVCWLLLWFRAFEVQVLLGPVYSDMAERQHTYTEVIEGARGSILDRNGRVLARSVACQSVYANPRVMEDINDAAERLAPILKRDTAELAAIFRKNKAFIWLARKVDDATASLPAGVRSGPRARRSPTVGAPGSRTRPKAHPCRRRRCSRPDRSRRFRKRAG